MLRSANARELEDSNAAGVDSWEHFCREEARQAACSFLERVKRFKSRNASARDVHDSTFTNEFSAAFLEESSVLMASGDAHFQPSCGAVRMNGQLSQSHAGFPINRSASTRAGVGGRSRTIVRDESKTSVKSSSSGGKKAWWSNIFKWSKSKRDRRSNNGGGAGLSSSGEYLSPNSSRSNSSSHQQWRRRVILDGQVQLLDLNETEGPLQWTQCKLVLAEAQGHHQVEIFMPPKSSVPRTTLFCFLIEDVRSTSALEIPDSTTCFVIKSQNHGEHVFKADTESKKQRWIQALLDCKSQIIRSASAQTHLATLPRTPQRTPVRLPNGSTNRGVVSLDASPAMHCGVGGGGARGSGPRYASYASSDSSEQKKSTLNVGAESDGEDSMMDVTSLIRRLNHASPSRRRKVQSMFVDSSNLHSVHPTTATATMMTCSHYQPPPLLSYSPPNYEEDYLHHQPPSLPARLPFSSLPTDCSNSTSVSSPPPPLPKRNPPARSTSTSLSSSATNHRLPSPSSREAQHHPHRTSPSHVTHPVSSAATATSMTTPPSLPPMSTARLTAISTTNDVTSTSVSSITCNGTSAVSSSSSARIQASPRRKYSQSFVDIPPTIHSDSSQGNLELCSQSSSSSALHPVSLAAVQRSMATTNNGRRRSSITSNPGDSAAVTQPMSLINQQAFQKPSDRVRKVSAPVLISGDPAKQLSLVGKGEESPLQKEGDNGAVPGQKNVYDSSDILNNVAKETSPVPESDREQEKEERTAGDWEGEREREKERERKGESDEDKNGRGKEREKSKIELCESEQASSTSGAGDGSRGDGSGVAESALSLVQRRQQEECNGITENGISDEATSRKATFTFPYNSSQTSQASNSGCSPPVPPRTSSPLLIQQRSEARGRSGSPLTPDLVTSHLSYNHRSPLPRSLSQQENEESEGGGLMVGTLVAGTGMGSGPLLGTVGSGRVGGGVPERRGHRRGHSLISSHSIQTNPSTRTNSSSSDGTESNPTNSSAPGISNPIYVETTEGERARVSQRVELHTQHPYEHWATSQQDVANLRLLSRYPWFHGMVSRANASQLVLAEGESGTGQYLVRQSESREGDFVLTFNYHNRAKHLRMAVDEGGCNIQHLWFDDVPSMLDYFKTNSIPLESFWLNDDVKLTAYIDRQASDSFRTTTVVNMDRLTRVPPRRSRSLHLGMANSVNSAAATSANSSNPDTPLPLDANASSASSSNSQSTNSLPQSARNSTGWRLFRSQRSSSAGNVGRVQRRHSANVGSLLNTGMNSNRSSGRRRRSNNENNYLVRNY